MIKTYYLCAVTLFCSIYSPAQNIYEELKSASFSNPDSVINVTKDLIASSKKDSVRAYYLLIAGISFRNKGDFAKSIALLDSASQIGGSSVLASAFQNKGASFRLMGRYADAIESNLKALRIFESLGHEKEIGITLNSLGVSYMKMGDNTMALKYYDVAHAKAIEQKDTASIGNVLNNIAIIHANKGSLDSAEFYFRKGLNLELEKNNLKGISAGLNNVGAVKYYLSDLDSAILYFEKALRIDQKMGDIQGIPLVMNNIAEIAIQNQSYDLAKKYLDSAILLGKQASSLRELETSYLNLAGLYEAQKAFEDAFRTIQVSYAYRDSMLNESNSQQIAELQTKYETEKKEQQIALQQAEIAEQQAQNQRNTILIVALIILVILLVIVSLLIRSRSQKKQALLLQEAQIKLRETQIEAALNSQESERKRFARDLHDGFGQMISVLNLNLKSLEKGNSDRNEVFANSSKVLDDMYKELKGICFNLMPETLIKSGVIDALKEFAGRVNQTGKLILEIDTFGIDERLTDLQEISIYRISQEWINNVLKYSDATKITLSLTKDEEELTLLIEDNGSGFDKNDLIHGKGNGWKNMNSRANLIKGELELDTNQATMGSTLIINAPIHAKHRENDANIPA
ncbi:MAG: histidine kinase [Cyclobacteriaceae bacterium]